MKKVLCELHYMPYPQLLLVKPSIRVWKVLDAISIYIEENLRMVCIVLSNYDESETDWMKRTRFVEHEMYVKGLVEL